MDGQGAFIIVIITLLSIFVAFVGGYHEGSEKYRQVKAEHITPCEAELPRNQHCEMVYSARVAEPQ